MAIPKGLEGITKQFKGGKHEETCFLSGEQRQTPPRRSRGCGGMCCKTVADRTKATGRSPHESEPARPSPESPGVLGTRALAVSEERRVLTECCLISDTRQPLVSGPALLFPAHYGLQWEQQVRETNHLSSSIPPNQNSPTPST